MAEVESEDQEPRLFQIARGSVKGNAVICLSGDNQAFRLSQEGSSVTVIDLYRRRPIETHEFADENAAFEALCGLRNELRLEAENDHE